MTRVGGKSAAPTDHVTHVGVICGRGMLTSEQRMSLGRQLQRIAEERRGHLLILHHGCGHDGDEVAHRAARVLGGWGIHGHPPANCQKMRSCSGLGRTTSARKPPARKPAAAPKRSPVLKRSPAPEPLPAPKLPPAPWTSPGAPAAQAHQPAPKAARSARSAAPPARSAQRSAGTPPPAAPPAQRPAARTAPQPRADQARRTQLAMITIPARQSTTRPACHRAANHHRHARCGQPRQHRQDTTANSITLVNSYQACVCDAAMVNLGVRDYGQPLLVAEPRCRC